MLWMCMSQGTREKEESKAAVCAGVDAVWLYRMDSPYSYEREVIQLGISAGTLQQAIQMVGAGLTLVTSDPDKCLVGGHVQKIFVD